jgi:hypothetical protein
MLVARAADERQAMRDATAELQAATERCARIAVIGMRLVRRYWLPVGVLAASGLLKRARPILRAAQTGLVLWQTVRMLRNVRQ